MSTHATIRIVVKHRTGFAVEPGATSVARMLQYADGMEDFVRPRLERALEEVANHVAEPSEFDALTVARTYGRIADEGLKDWQKSLTALVTSQVLKDQAGRWQYLVEVDVELFTGTFNWRVIGGSDLTA